MMTFLQFIAEEDRAINGVMDRKQLPQLDDSEYTPFEEFLRDKQVGFEHILLSPEILQPTQNTLDDNKIQKIRQQIRDYSGIHGWWQFYLSHDNRILDGHHRWAAVKEELPDAKLPCVKVDASFPELVALGHEFKAQG